DKYGFTDKSKDYTFLRGEFGLGRGFYFWRNFSLSPYVGMGWEMASLNKNFSVSAPYYKAGANLCLNVYYPFQLVGGVSGFFYGSPTLKEKEKDDSNSDSDADSKSKTFSNYDDIFSGRRGSNVSGFVGIRFNF
ncbi:MAG: hypothetical protein LBO71_07415, partial [Prevotellaceae bacterium]|nr:hypothetical protein [Prevotellaceae bacterium]